MRRTIRHDVLAAIAAACLMCPPLSRPASAQQPGESAGDPAVAQTDGDRASQDGVATEIAGLTGVADEEVIVRGSRSLRRMRIDVGRARLDFYDLYNRLNDNDRFDMSCRMEYVLGSRIKREICMPAHARQAYSVAARLEAQGAGSYDPLPDILSSNRRMAEDMAQLINANPELLEAVQRYENMLEDYRNAARDEFGE